jgi:aspartate 1-decarboxylase
MMCKSKLHGLVVTETKLNYEGSITLDPEIFEKVDLLPYEKVDVFNLNNGLRFTTYLIPGERGKGEVCLNGPAARLGEVGDQLIVVSYALFTEEELKNFKPKIMVVQPKEGR